MLTHFFHTIVTLTFRMKNVIIIYKESVKGTLACRKP